jgi:hypothetical protein
MHLWATENIAFYCRFHSVVALTQPHLLVAMKIAQRPPPAPDPEDQKLCLKPVYLHTIQREDKEPVRFDPCDSRPRFRDFLPDSIHVIQDHGLGISCQIRSMWLKTTVQGFLTRFDPCDSRPRFRDFLPDSIHVTQDHGLGFLDRFDPCDDSDKNPCRIRSVWWFRQEPMSDSIRVMIQTRTHVGFDPCDDSEKNPCRIRSMWLRP